jgi:hypothetical protein
MSIGGAAALALTFSMALSLAACGPKPAEGGKTEAVAPAGFPKPTASYAATYKIFGKDGKSRDMTIYADHGRVRSESEMPGANVSTATIVDPTSQKMITFRTGPDAPKVAMTMSRDTLGAAADFFDMDKDRPQATVVGEADVAGEHCRVWRMPPAVEGGDATLTCVTNDGVFLRGAKEADPEHPSIEAVTVKRGGQDAALFATPAGYEVVDYSPCLTLTQDAMAAMKAGKKPDMVKMKECQALGEKLGGLFGK